MAVDFGYQPQQVVAAARERAEQQEDCPENSTQAKEAVTFARESIFEREAVADERAILRDALRCGMGEATYGEIRAEFEKRREAGDFRSAQGEKYSSGRSFTTSETIGAEHANVRRVAVVQIGEFGRVQWSFGELRTSDEQAEQHRRVVCRAAL
jgi:hypothetical protein